MNTLTLNNQENIPVLGIGTYLLTSEQAEKSVTHALKSGYRLVDTANMYRNERAVGRAIKASGVPGEEIFLTTKLWPREFKYQKAVQAIDDSLERLGVDYIDMILLHQPVGKISEAWQALEEAVAAGKVRTIGVSNFTVADLEKLLGTAHILPAVNQVECHPYFQQSDLKAYMAEKGIALEAWYPLGSGNKDLQAEAIFQTLAKKYDKSVVQVILRWHLQVGNILIPGSKNPAHVDSNFDIFDFELTADELAEIALLDKNKELAAIPPIVRRLFTFIGANYDKEA